MSAREQALPAALERAVLGEGETATKSSLLRLQRLRAAWPAVRRELLAEAERDGAELHARAAERFGSLVDAVVDQIAAGGSLGDVLEVVGDAANNCDYVDDDLIERWERARAVAAQPPSASAAALEELLGELEESAKESRAVLERESDPTCSDALARTTAVAKSAICELEIFARRLRKAVGWEEER